MLSDKIRLNAFCHVDENGRWQKMKGELSYFRRDDFDPNLHHFMVYLEYDAVNKLVPIIAREHFIAKGWFATVDGRIFHYTKRHGLNEISPDCTLLRREQKFHVTKNGVHGHTQSYIKLPHELRLLLHQGQLHAFIFECWYGARTPGMQIDHINGCELDNRIINLQEVTPEENRYRGIVLDSMRKAKDENGMPIYNMAVFEKEPFRLINIFDIYRHLYRPKTNNPVLKLAINPSYDKTNHRHGNK